MKSSLHFLIYLLAGLISCTALFASTFDFSPALGSYFTNRSEVKNIWWTPSFSEGWDGPWLFRRYIIVTESAFKDFEHPHQPVFAFDIPKTSTVVSKFDQGFHRSSPSAITAEQDAAANP